MPETENTQTPAPVAAALAAAPRPVRITRPTSSSTSRRPGPKKAALAGTPAGGGDPHFENGPLAVVDVEGGRRRRRRFPRRR
ncbi:hypothetical protein ACWGRL_08355 [[Kitasatospora] papulosa]